MKDKEERSSKRYKSSGEGSFNTRESGDGSFNLNRTVGDEEDEVQEVRRSRPIGRDQAKRKAKAGTSWAGSTNAIDVESLAKLMANEYAMGSDPYNVQKGQEMTELLQIKKQELELKTAELEIHDWKTVKELKRYICRLPMKSCRRYSGRGYSVDFTFLIYLFLTATSLRKAATLSITTAQRTLVQMPKKPTPRVIVKSPVLIKNCVLGLANVETWDCIVKRSFGVEKPGSCADKAKGKRKL
ncbi:hypothetical protein Tco_1371098 [Tanacetum coccineum]